MKSLNELEQRLGYTFKNIKLLKRAVTHRSYGAEHNERLEFLGDSVLNCVIGNALFQKEDHFDEGSLSRVRANLVCQNALVEVAEILGISDFLNLGEGEMRSGGGHRPSIMADAVEAVFGAIFMDGSFEQAQAVILRLYEPVLNKLTPSAMSKDAKTLLQEKLQSAHYSLPIYEICRVTGAQHDQTFEVYVKLPALDIEMLGCGKSRRQAEQDAASKALADEKLQGLF
ncbi:MAG: ribonuclease III [Burkholderiaceae bacterium]|nr:ribonuclease III [Burkholderiaceae bacterium]